jgi:serine/threonine protein kinase
MPVPAEMLLGLTLPRGGWKVVERIAKLPGQTGAMFSVNYIVESPTGERAFLKALNLNVALRSPDWLRRMQTLLEMFNYERDLLQACHGFDRVVTAIDEGELDIDPSNPLGRVPYLIFELGDGDIRRHMAVSGNLDVAWSLRCLHHVAIGMGQLHGGGIAHQDVKPSNVMTFGERGSQIGDLGTASRRGAPAPVDQFDLAGDPSYAPPEYQYGYVPAEWDERHMGCDLYLFGSLVAFMFTQVGMTGLLELQLAPAHRHGIWRGGFQAVLPYLHNAFALALDSFGRSAPPEYRDELVEAVRHLCSPDPSTRGHPADRRGHHDPYSLRRYVTLFDRLATRAERRVVGRRK